MRIGLVSAAYPPVLDGIGDYTWWLAKTLAERGDVVKPVTVFTRIGDDHRSAPGVEVVPFFDPTDARTFTRLFDFFSRTSDLRPPTSDSRFSTFNLDWLILQYNPFSWGRRGYCPRVLSTLKSITNLPSAPKVAVMFHETFTRERGFKGTLMRTWQKVLCRQIAKLADKCLVSCETYGRDLCLTDGLAANSLAVGSNLPDPGIESSNAKRLLGFTPQDLVIGTFGTAHPSRKWDWINDAMKKIQLLNIGARFLHVGGGGSVAKQLIQDVPLITTGAVSDLEAAKAIRAIDLFLSPFSDGLSMRRTSVAVALQQGIPVISTDGCLTDCILRNENGRSLVLVSANDKAGFLEKAVELAKESVARGSVGKEGRRFFERVFDWEVVCNRMVALLSAERRSRL